MRARLRAGFTGEHVRVVVVNTCTQHVHFSLRHPHVLHRG